MFKNGVAYGGSARKQELAVGNGMMHCFRGMRDRKIERKFDPSPRWTAEHPMKVFFVVFLCEVFEWRGAKHCGSEIITSF